MGATDHLHHLYRPLSPGPRSFVLTASPLRPQPTSRSPIFPALTALRRSPHLRCLHSPVVSPSSVALSPSPSSLRRFARQPQGLSRCPTGLSSFPSFADLKEPSLPLHSFPPSLPCSSHRGMSSLSSSPSVLHLSFEVWGRVQGVNFRHYTRERAVQLGLKGWVANTTEGTVKGEVVGERRKVEEFQRFLREEGSPQCRIDRVQVKAVDHPQEGQYRDFDIRR